MFTKISVLIPTRGRVDRLCTLLESFWNTTTDGAAELIFRIDTDDIKTQDFLVNYKKIIGPRFHGYASVPTFFNELAAVASGDVLLCGNDDMVFKTPDWPAKILAAANRYPDGLFDIGVSTHNETHYPFSIVSKKVVDHLGFLFDTRFFWGDLFLRDVMNAFGRCRMLPDVVIDHDWAGFKPDEVFDEGEVWRRTDHAATHALVVADAVEKLRGMAS